MPTVFPFELRLYRLAWSLTAILLLATQATAQAPPKTQPKPVVDAQKVYLAQVVPFIKQYCLECHTSKKPDEEIQFDRYKDAASVEADAKTWQRVLEMLHASAMPPDDKPQPSEAQRKQIIAWIEQTIYRLDCDNAPDPGRVTIRRLNRAEYNNTIRDLLGVTFRPADDFPSDDVGSGFDNQGDVLSLPPLLFEKYLAAAEKIATSAIVANPEALVKTQRMSRQLESVGGKWSRGEGGWGILSDGGVKGTFEIERAGEYTLRAIAGAQNINREPAELELRQDGKALKVFDIYAPRDRQRNYELKVKLPKGKLELSAHFLNDFYDEKASDPKRRDRNLYVTALEIQGPLEVSGSDYPESHRRLIATLPGDSVSVQQAAVANLKPLMQRAFRRKVSEQEVVPFAGLVASAVKDGEKFEAGMQIALQAVLISPHFLFRLERDAQPNNPEQVHEIGQYELATRLSYFLWSSLPDDELFVLANQGKLHQPEVLKQQVRRMLQDPRAEALTQNFALQWLNLRMLDTTSPDPKVFAGFDDRLKADMRRETEMFFQTIVKEDRSIVDFLQGDFTFLNERLAKHYELNSKAKLNGDEFVRVSLAGSPRRGVLSQASVLTLTSNPERTSPVKRGKWILENILGAPPPDPPPDVPQLDATQKAQPNLTLRQQLEVHRQNAVCASCHKTMDALGFGLENFDAVGRWRDKDGKDAIDSSGILPNGDKFKGPSELTGVLVQRKQEFARCFTEKMMVYALGRGLAPYDRCAAEEIVKAAASDQFKISAIVTQIVLSDPFRKRRGDGGKP
jgi:mono/diheme cytochrome c family protein